MTQDRLERLESAIESLDFEIESTADIHRIEPVLDGIVSALRFFWELPRQSLEFAVPLDETLAYLAKQGVVSASAVKDANRLIERAGRVTYNPEVDGTLEETNQYRAELYEALKELLEQLRAEEDEYEEEEEEPDDD